MHAYVIAIANKQAMYTIDHLHACENILIEQLIAVTSRLDAPVALKNVLQPMEIRRLTAIKQLSQTKYTV